MGFCMGGALSFLAGQEADVDAIAPFYGTPDPKLAKVPLHVTKSEEHSGTAHTHLQYPDLMLHMACMLRYGSTVGQHHHYTDLTLRMACMQCQGRKTDKIKSCNWIPPKIRLSHRKRAE